MKNVPVRRHLRLKEWQPLIDRQLRPTPGYLAATDGSVRDIEYRVRTDIDGYILPPPSDVDVVKDSVIFFGDSLVESIYVPDNLRFVAAIQSMLIEAGMPTRCLNAGYSGATTLHMLMSLIGKVGRRPDTTIVLIIPSNDAFALTKHQGFWCRDEKRYSPIVPVNAGVPIAAQPIDLASLQVVINLFIDACRRLGLKLVLGSFPHRTATYIDDRWLIRRFKSEVAYQRTHALRASVNSVARVVAKRREVPFIDLELLASKKIEWFYDDLHMNEVGSIGIKELIGTFLIELIKSSKR